MDLYDMDNPYVVCPIKQAFTEFMASAPYPQVMTSDMSYMSTGLSVTPLTWPRFWPSSLPAISCSMR